MSTHVSGPVISTNGFSGNVTATTVTASGTVTFSGLPTEDPHVAGQLWSDSGVLTVSAG